MATISRQLQINVNVDDPINEIMTCISAISNCHGARKKEILQAIELKIGEALEPMKEGENKGAET